MKSRLRWLHCIVLLHEVLEELYFAVELFALLPEPAVVSLQQADLLLTVLLLQLKPIVGPVGGVRQAARLFDRGECLGEAWLERVEAI